MSSRILNKDIKIIAVDPSGAVRQLLTESIRAESFENVQGVASLKDALGVLEVEPVDWLVTPLLADEDINAFHILDLIINHEELKNTRITLLLEEDEKSVIPEAIEKGCLSWFFKPFNKDSIKATLKEFFSALEAQNGNEIKTTFKLFDSFLEGEKKHSDRIALSKSMLNHYSGEPLYIESLIEAYKASEDNEGAKSALRQLIAINPSKAEEKAALIKELFGDAGLEAAEGESTINVLGLNQVVIIDNDDSNRNSIKDWFTELGVPEIHDFEDGESAWKHIDSQEKIDAIITEWRIPQLTGPLLIQRIRHKFPSVPIILQSALVQGQDKPLVYEMGVASIIEKPFEKAQFLSQLVSAIQQDKIPSDMETMERKIRQHLRAREVEQANEIASNYLADTSIPDQRKNKIKAEIAYSQEKWAEAKIFATEAIKSTTDSIMLLNLLGRIMMKTGEFQGALKCFEKAQELSPMNIGRLCEIAEVQSEIGDGEAAKESIEEAKAQDDESDAIVESEAKVEMTLGNSEAAKQIMAKMDSLSEVISYMNNKAVALAKTGKIEDSISLYNKTFDSVPDDKPDIKAIVKYNLGLAMIRQKLLPEALKAVSDAIAIGESRVLAKASSLKGRIQSSLDNGTELKMQNNSEVTTESEELGSPSSAPSLKLGSVSKSAGSHGMFKLFQASAKDNLVEKMSSKKPPRFIPRETIQREASLSGIETKAS